MQEAAQTSWGEFSVNHWRFSVEFPEAWRVSMGEAGFERTEVAP